MDADRPKPFTEKTIYRTQKFAEDRADANSSRCSSGKLNMRPRMSRTRGSAQELNHEFMKATRGQTATPFNNNKLNKSHDNIDWNGLGEKIEDWFGYAKTPDQRVVYRFLKNIHNDDDCGSVLSERPGSSAPAHIDNTQSLEDILDNLKKYRNKFNRASACKSAKPMRSQGLPNVNKDGKEENLDKMFESSTWRVMRHLKSADIRSKYPLPKANPDYHFRNATVFQTAGRAPKSTFLLHPDWV